MARLDIPNDQRHFGLDGFLYTLGCERRTVIRMSATEAYRNNLILNQTHGTKMAEAFAPVSFLASATLAKTGRPRWVSPAFLGFVPPTTLVPAMEISQTQYYFLRAGASTARQKHKQEDVP
jgi:hypothetical protein